MEIKIAGKFYFIPDKFPNPFTFILLRLALLTIGSITYGSYLLKDKIIKILMTGKKEAPVSFNREIKIKDSFFEIIDIIKIKNNLNFNELVNIDEFSTIMVPQSQYFQDYELNTNLRNIAKKDIEALNEKRELKVSRKIYFE